MGCAHVPSIRPSARAPPDPADDSGWRRRSHLAGAICDSCQRRRRRHFGSDDNPRKCVRFHGPRGSIRPRPTVRDRRRHRRGRADDSRTSDVLRAAGSGQHRCRPGTGPSQHPALKRHVPHRCGRPPRRHPNGPRDPTPRPQPRARRHPVRPHRIRTPLIRTLRIQTRRFRFLTRRRPPRTPLRPPPTLPHPPARQPNRTSLIRSPPGRTRTRSPIRPLQRRTPAGQIPTRPNRPPTSLHRSPPSPAPILRSPRPTPPSPRLMRRSPLSRPSPRPTRPSPRPTRPSSCA